MATILERGREIVSALRAYAAEMSAGRERRQLLTVCQILERGDSGEGIRALAELPESWIPLLSAATTAGDAGQMVHGFLSESRRSDTLRHQWWLMLAYPVAIFGLTTAVMMALAIFVIPEFEEIFAEFDLELPLITLQLLKISTFLSSWGALILVILLGLSMIMLLNANRWLPSSASAWLTGRFRLPFGRRTSIARFARFTADLLEAGVSIPDALRIAGFTVSRSPMQQAAWRLANDIESTGGFSQRLYQRPLTASIAYALAAELPPESRVRLLREISDSHADRVRIRVSWASGIVEPVAILVVGFTVGCAVIGLFLPLVKLIDGLTM